MLASTGQYLGVTLGFQYSAQLSGPPTYPNQQNQSNYNPDPNNPNLTWQVWAEQLAQAGVDFICPNLTGSQPNTNGDPIKIAPMITALNNLGLASKIKFAAFDDNAASWTAQWNMANGRGYGYAKPFDISIPDNCKYIYDWNYKRFFQTIPDANRFKIDGRPVIIIWSGNTYFIANMNGNVSKALTYVRQQCQSEFGFNPFIILSEDFYRNDPTCLNAGIADASQNWFWPSAQSFTMSSMNGYNVGCAVPQFYHPGQGPYTDPNHGVLFDNGLAGTVGAGAKLILCEGFTDYEEDAAMWRAANINPDGSARTYVQSGYDYPNQRINLLRKWSSDPFPTELKLEAEGCDNFGGATGGNGKTNYYRNGNIAIAESNDTMGGHHVGWMASNEWLEWQSLPFKSGYTNILLRIATPNANMQVRIEVDGVVKQTKTLPNTGSWTTWTTFDVGSLGNYSNSNHRVRIVFTTGGVNFNWCQLLNSENGVPIGSTIWLQNGGKYVCSENGGSAMNCYRTSVGVWEKFLVVDGGNGTIALRGSNNLYVTSTSPMWCNGSSIATATKFTWVILTSNTVALKSSTNMYVCSENGASSMNCNRTTVGVWETFSWAVAN